MTNLLLASLAGAALGACAVIAVQILFLPHRAGMSRGDRGRVAKTLKHLHQSIRNLRHTMTVLSDLQAQVAASIEVEESAITLIAGLKTKLDEAIASGDPAALQALSDSLGAEKDKLAAAVAANTPADPAA